MNCPLCNRPVGEDEFGYGVAIPIVDTVMHRTIGHRIPLTVWCENCGIFDVRLNERGQIHSAMQLSDDASIARAVRRLPDTAQERVPRAVPA